MIAMLAPLVLFAVAAAFSPGPNNIMGMGMAATLGFRRTVPFGAGVVVGIGVMTTVVAIGLAVPLARYPVLVGVMRWAGAIWLLVLAWKLLRAPGVIAADGRAPLGFWGAVGFQWINPKAWIMAVAAAAAFGLHGYGLVSQALIRAAVFVLVGMASQATWMLMGLGIGRLLATERRVRGFNIAMGLLLAASVVPAVLE